MEDEDAESKCLSWLDAMNFKETEEFVAVDVFIEQREVVSRIEALVLVLLNARERLGLDVVSRSLKNSAVSKSQTVRLRSHQKLVHRPQAIAEILKVLAFVHALLQERKHVTQRDIYYCLIKDFRSQGHLNRTIQECVCLLHCSRMAMNISTTNRGFVAGCLLWEEDMDLQGVDCRALGCQGYAIPGMLSSDLKLRRTSADVRAIVVVEKDSVFQQLCESRLWEILPCILITGCGFPDAATRIVLWKIVSENPELVVYGLVDHNPFGVSILMTYKHGSRMMGLDMFQFTVPIAWLGLHASDKNDSTLSLPLSERDIALKETLLSTPMVPQAWKEELTAMKRKTELQAVYNAFTAVSNVSEIARKIISKRYI
ncbi:hypothetical protein DIPPA_70133 [Diplonema papillatum]|nr:hypothetical protein DIPPA_70133 [Diplonema papillatum]